MGEPESWCGLRAQPRSDSDGHGTQASSGETARGMFAESTFETAKGSQSQGLGSWQSSLFSLTLSPASPFSSSLAACPLLSPSYTQSLTHLFNFSVPGPGHRVVKHITRHSSTEPSPKKPSLVAQTAKDLPAIQETQVRSLSWEDPLKKEMAIHSSILAWRIPWTEEPGGLHSLWGLT